MRPQWTYRLRAIAATACAGLLIACVYRLDTQQGNLLDPDQVESVETGMTRSQVRFLLGTPMVADPFDKDRWDYFFYFRRGKNGETLKSHVVVWFDGDLVSRIDRPPPVAKPDAAPAAKT